ncbi:MAG: ATPase domain-containing protein [Casimicrobiaceae bacterium]
MSSEDPDFGRVLNPATTGIAGLDTVLRGGFTRERVYLVDGLPGNGKTTLALQFLLTGRDNGERCLYVTFSETETELRAVAHSHGWDLAGIDILEVVPAQEMLGAEQHYTLFHPAEVELSETANAILGEIDRKKPQRVIFDSLSELRLLAGDTLQYRRQVMGLKQFFAGRGCTVILLDDASSHIQVQSLMHGVLRLESTAEDFGGQRRRMRVVKYRGVGFHGGYHDLEIRRGGIKIFPRLAASPRRTYSAREVMSTGVPSFDNLLGGGIERGTSTLITGAAGSGKSTLAAKFATTAAERGQRAALFLFDERLDTLVERCEGLGIPLARNLEAGKIDIHQVAPGDLSPGEFTAIVCGAVDADNASVVVIDSLNGYLNSMPHERHLLVQLHELLMYLGHSGVSTILVAVQHGLVGQSMSSPVDTSYLADSVVLLRYFEAFGQVRQAISVLKRRGGRHERTIREFSLETGEIRIGEPLREFQGVLTGLPMYVGAREPLLREEL